MIHSASPQFWPAVTICYVLVDFEKLWRPYCTYARTDRRTDMCECSDHYQQGRGRPRWIKNWRRGNNRGEKKDNWRFIINKGIFLIYADKVGYCGWHHRLLKYWIGQSFRKIRFCICDADFLAMSLKFIQCNVLIYHFFMQNCIKNIGSVVSKLKT